MELKFTPGPWVAWDVPSAGWQIGTKRCSERSDRFYGNIASIMFYQLRPGHDGGPFIPEWLKERDKADALLIAAAPDMYDALLTARKALEHDAPGSCWAAGPLTGNPVKDLVVCPGCEAIQQIDAALVKAQGAPNA